MATAAGPRRGGSSRRAPNRSWPLHMVGTLVGRKGIRVAVYRDRHGIFEPVIEPTRGRQPGDGHGRSLSQVGRALVELGIESIPAASPQAKGRIERLWGTWQDRLVTEL